VSDPRNSVLASVFRLIDVWRVAENGIWGILGTWKKPGMPAQIITEYFEPERISVLLGVKTE